jgi:hypothetical protein
MSLGGVNDLQLRGRVLKYQVGVGGRRREHAETAGSVTPATTDSPRLPELVRGPPPVEGLRVQEQIDEGVDVSVVVPVTPPRDDRIGLDLPQIALFVLVDLRPRS